MLRFNIRLFQVPGLSIFLTHLIAGRFLQATPQSGPEGLLWTGLPPAANIFTPLPLESTQGTWLNRKLKEGGKKHSDEIVTIHILSK